MFYKINTEINPIDIENIDESCLTAGFISAAELLEIGGRFGFSQSTINSCQKANKYFRSDVEIHDNYLFTELRIADPNNIEEFDCVSLYIKKNLIIVVDVEDYDSSTKNKFLDALKRYPADNLTIEKLIFAFIDALISNDFKYIEDKGNEITLLEEEVIKDNVEDDFSLELLHLKKELLTMHNYYEQLLDITDAIEENENELFNDDKLIYIMNVSNKIQRLREDTDSLSSSVNHLQDAYSSSLDIKLNNVMKRFTVITSIFFPLTLIVGWYGMNFRAMPEFAWKYGYVYVIALSVIVVSVLIFISKKKKWF
ncbi:MAG: hypothetical protein IJ731_06760 [Eubacterium sp.]|nr:hypothetical protein [Eubacterium sp.]